MIYIANCLATVSRRVRGTVQGSANTSVASGSRHQARPQHWAASLVFALLVTHGAVQAQQLLWRHDGVENGYRINSRCSDMGDVDGDGWHDLIAMINEPINTLSGRVLVLSGRDGRTRLMDHAYSEVALGFRWPIFLGPAGDFDGDRVPDWWWTTTGSSVRPNVEIRSGRTGSALLKVASTYPRGPFGFSVLGDIDTDGDRRPDLVVADPIHYAYAGGRIHVYDNRGSRRYLIEPPQNSGFTYARDLAKLGDVDGDGCDDFVMACPEPSGRGAAVVISGRAGGILHVGYGELPGDQMHMRVTRAGDIDCDGIADFAATGGVYGAFRGTVRVFSGRSGSPLLTIVKPTEPDLGNELVGGFDIDQDGVPDLLTLSKNFTWPYLHDRAYVFSGRDGRELYQIRDNFGSSYLTLLPAAPGSPFPLFVDASPSNSGLPLVGRIICYRLMPAGTSYLGDGCAGGNGLLLGVSPQAPPVGRGRVTLSGPPGAACALLVGSPSSPIELAHLGYPGCWQRSSGASLVLPVLLDATGPNRGLASLELPLPFGDRTYRDPVFDWQGVLLAPSGLRLSGGIRARVLR